MDLRRSREIKATLAISYPNQPLELMTDVFHGVRRQIRPTFYPVHFCVSYTMHGYGRDWAKSQIPPWGS